MGQRSGCPLPRVAPGRGHPQPQRESRPGLGGPLPAPGGHRLHSRPRGCGTRSGLLPRGQQGTVPALLWSLSTGELTISWRAPLSRSGPPWTFSLLSNSESADEGPTCLSLYMQCDISTGPTHTHTEDINYESGGPRGRPRTLTTTVLKCVFAKNKRLKVIAPKLQPRYPLNMEITGKLYFLVYIYLYFLILLQEDVLLL